MGLTVVEFGDQLLRTRDLDPVYVAVSASKLDSDTTNRLLLAYWCFYHLGVAARMAEIKQPKRFWAAMEDAAINTSNPDGTKPWPRGAERRHFRGAQAIQAVAALAGRYKNATDAVFGMLGHSLKLGTVRPGWLGKGEGGSHDLVGWTFKSVSASAQSHRGFGPWISFKIADMAERVLGVPVDFSDCELGIYKDPRQGAAVALFQMEGYTPPGMAFSEVPPDPWNYPITDDDLRLVVQYYVALWRKKRAKAPPDSGRLVNVQEIETIFCKYKSHLKGHYPLGKDTREIHHGLEGWGDLAQQLRENLPCPS